MLISWLEVLGKLFGWGGYLSFRLFNGFGDIIHFILLIEY